LQGKDVRLRIQRTALLEVSEVLAVKELGFPIPIDESEDEDSALVEWDIVGGGGRD
jgi:hypothetical protein